MSTGLILMLAQIDDASGELLAEVVGRLEKLGAKNVQLLSSLTKKGRPGYVMMVDILADKEDEAATLLAEELGIWGYRVLAAEHKHVDIERFTADLILRHEAQAHRFSLRAKKIRRDGRPIRIKVEHDDLSRICGELRDIGLSLPLSVLKARVESTLSEQHARSDIEISADDIGLQPSH